MLPTFVVCKVQRGAADRWWVFTSTADIGRGAAVGLLSCVGPDRRTVGCWGKAGSCGRGVMSEVEIRVRLALSVQRNSLYPQLLLVAASKAALMQHKYIWCIHVRSDALQLMCAVFQTRGGG